MAKLIDLTDKIFERLTVVKHHKKDNNGNNYWLCKCDCGNEELISVRGNSLTFGNTKSCGCLQKENTSKGNKKYN